MSSTAEWMHPWASTLPWDCLVRPTDCVSATHNHSPMVGQQCAAPGCEHALIEGETCYAVTEVERVEDREQWVCWRHVGEHPVVVAVEPGE